MKKKIICIFVFTLMIATAFPAVESIKNSTINTLVPTVPLANMKTNWTEMQKILVSDGTPNNYFWAPVSVDGALAFVMPTVAFVNGRTIELPSNNKHPNTVNNGYHEGWPQIITGDANVWGGIVSPVVSDLDKDGSKELIVTQQGEPSKLYVFEQNGSLKFDIIEMPDYSPYIDPRSFPSIGDINNDGFEEIILESRGPEDKIMIYSHNGTLLYEWEAAYMVSDELYGSIVLADLDSDNNLELIYGGWWVTGCRLVVLDNEGNNVPGFPVILENIQMSQMNTPAVGNFDGDSDLEIVVISHENNQPVDLTNIRAFDTNGSLLWAQELDSIVDTDPAVGDINHDGFDEVVFTSPKGVHILDRHGEYLVNKYLGHDNGDSSDIALADLNGDKNLEVIFGYYTSIYTMDYDGTILWEHSTGWNAHYPPVVGDITGDGIPDIVTNSDSNVWAWNSQGELLNGFPISIESNAYGACSLDDIDNNGYVELIASSDWKWNDSNYNEGYIYVWDLSAEYISSTMEWPMFQHDPQHTGMYPHSLVAPVLEIGNFIGGLFKVKVTIKNIGGAEANNINWTITLTGGFVLLGKETTGSIIALDPDDEQTITSMPIIGLGKTVITVTATVTGNTVFKEQNAKILLFLIVIK